MKACKTLFKWGIMMATIINIPLNILAVNEITTTQLFPINSSNSICAGSAFSVQFYSTGSFEINNTYQCQISDAFGNFVDNEGILASVLDHNSYDPMLGSLPGSISGQLPISEPGCGYFIRVLSNLPFSVVSSWGPFCIEQCDITLNSNNNISACVSQCSVDSTGFNLALPIQIHTFNDNINYQEGNTFVTKLYDAGNFSEIGDAGMLGQIESIGDATLQLHVPCKDSLGIYGIEPGEYFLEVISTYSSELTNPSSNIITLTIGAYADEGVTVVPYLYPDETPQSIYCIPDITHLQIEPFSFNSGSTYQWLSNGINDGLPFYSPFGENAPSLFVELASAGVLSFQIQETSFGCMSEWSDTTFITVLPDPSTTIFSVDSVCVDEEVLCQVEFSDNVIYQWNTNALENEISYWDSTLNSLSVAFSESGTYEISILISHQCGPDSSTTNVTVYPELSPVDILQSGDSIYVSGLPTNAIIQWYFNNEIIPGAENDTLISIGTGLYSVVVSNQCGSVADEEYIIGVNESDHSQWLIYPNPVSDQIWIVHSGTNFISGIRILDITGKVVIQDEYNNELIAKIPLRQLSTGVYYMEIERSDQSILQRTFIKE